MKVSQSTQCKQNGAIANTGHMSKKHILATIHYDAFMTVYNGLSFCSAVIFKRAWTQRTVW